MAFYGTICAVPRQPWAYEELTVPVTVVSPDPTKVEGSLAAYIRVIQGQVRFRMDGSDPNNGDPAGDFGIPFFDLESKECSREELERMKFIRADIATADAVLSITYYR